MKAVIFAGASMGEYEFCTEYLVDADMVICCDSGLRHAKALGIVPDAIVGDFDSVDREVLAYYRQMEIPIRQFPCKKNETDMQLGIRLAVEKGATDLILFGGIGDRLDHTMANTHLLLGLLKKNIRARLVDEKNCVELIDRKLVLQGKAGDLVSTIPLSMMVKGLTLTGFAYPLTEWNLLLDDELVAVSNVMLAEKAEISLTEGYLFVIRSRD